MPSDYESITHHNERQLGLDTASRRTQICMYSDSTHFVYEILQNADDYGATEVSFHLTEGELVIEHNGEPFAEEHVRAITYFGKSTSKDDLVKTGRFGVGFKSVFAFTASPTVVSGSEHFQIYGLYRVRRHPYPSDLEASWTRITIPFDHETEKPDYVEELMSPVEAYEKIASRLTGLNMNTLLFTQNIKEIRWEIKGGHGHYQREDTPLAHSRRTTITDGQQIDTYLVFHQIPHWSSRDYKAVEIAFALDKHRQIIPIQDSLYVLFPTTQETHLQFVLNGPFRTNPSRETISEDDHFNVHLMKEICALMQSLLPKLKENKLLTTQFLSVLPIADDGLRPFYAPLHDAIGETFKEQSLVPTNDNTYACAADIFQGPDPVRKVITKDDLRFFTGNERACWAKGGQQPRADQFLRGLGIQDWGWEELQAALNDNYGGAVTTQSDKHANVWLAQRTDAWLQKLYMLLGEGLKKDLCVIWKLRRCRIARVREKGQETHVAGEDACFPKGVFFCELRPLKHSLLAGKTEQVTKKLIESLVALGVSEIDDEKRVDMLLESFYGDDAVDAPKAHLQHLKLFMDWTAKSKKVDVFEDARIFRNEDGKLCLPSQIYLDAPFKKTGLATLFAPVWELECPRQPLWDGYLEKFPADVVTRFATACGILGELAIVQTTVSDNPQYYSLYWEWEHVRRTQTKTDEDYWIPNIDVWLAEPTLDTSLHIWKVMAVASPKFFKARYRPNSDAKHKFHEAPSRLLAALSGAAWVPDYSGSFKRPADLSRETLHPDFKFDEGEWLTKVGFGDNVQRATQADTDRVKVLSGMGASRKLTDKLMGFTEDEREQFFRKCESDLETSVEFPEKSVPDIERRTARAAELARRATRRTSETRDREVRVTKGAVDARTWLRQEYTNEADVMFCQMQGSAPKSMPFKYPDENGKFYFDACEFLGDLTVELRANYLALSPDCAAEFKHTCSLTDDEKRARLLAIDPNGSPESLYLELDTPVHGRLRFTQAHLVDLQAAIRAFG